MHGAKDTKRFTDFLASVDLAAYREKYRPIKIVEMDMPKDVQALHLLYEVYWTERRFLSYDDFFTRYTRTYKKELTAFRTKTTMCKDCFDRGLPARIYRTWASIITQIHAAYVAESVFGEGTVRMSAELDHQGADFQVNYKGITLNYQVKKDSMSGEVRRGKGGSKHPIPGVNRAIQYQVPHSDYFTNPKKKNGEYRLPYKRFIENTTLQRLPNGFVVFTKEIFSADKARIDAGELTA